jgi:hypothetical protein
MTTTNTTQARIIIQLHARPDNGKIKYSEFTDTTFSGYRTFSGKVSMFVTKGSKHHIGDSKIFRNNKGVFEAQTHALVKGVKQESWSKAFVTLTPYKYNLGLKDLPIGVIRVELSNGVYYDFADHTMLKFKIDQEGVPHMYAKAF